MRFSLTGRQQRRRDVRPACFDKVYAFADEFRKRIGIVRAPAHGEQPRLSARRNQPLGQILRLGPQTEQTGCLRGIDQRVNLARQIGHLTHDM